MYGMRLYEQIRVAVFLDGMSRREASAKFGVHRDTVKKALCHSVPPGYRRSNPVRRPKIGPFTGVVDAILERDLEAPKKQRHTIQRIFDRLKAEHGFDGGYTTVRDYVRERRLVMKEAFVPLSHPPGHGQVDFGEALVVIGGAQQKAAMFVMSLPYSDDVFVQVFPRETAEAWCEGHIRAFNYFGGVPVTILYDNSKRIVGRILGDGTRQRTQMFSGLVSHYLFKDRFGRPGCGNDKGKVEGLVGYTRRNFLVPIPRAASFDELNARLVEDCRKRRAQQLRGKGGTIGERFETDKTAFRDLPGGTYEACDRRSGQATSQALVRYRLSDYSVPVQYAHRQVLIKGFVDKVVICAGTEEIARHERSYERDDIVFDPLHYLSLLEKKPGALNQAAPLEGWELPDCFAEFRRCAEGRMGKHGKREYIQVLRLLETFRMELVDRAVQEALRLRVISYDAVKQLTLSAVERRPPRLNLESYPFLPKADAATTKAQSYLTLMSERPAA
ncbi:MAG: IS21 family transposase [Parvularculaceae bacterium]